MTKAEFLFEKLQIEKPWHLNLDDYDAKIFLIKFRELNPDDDIWIDIDKDLNWKAKLFKESKDIDFISLDFKNCIINALLYFYDYEQEVEDWQNKCMENFIGNISTQYDPDPGIDTMVDKHFWELLDIHNKH